MMNNDRLFQLERQRAVARQSACVPADAVLNCGYTEMRSWQVADTCRTAMIRKTACDRNHKVFDRYGKVTNAVFSYLCSC
jgi:hypothetical protein